MQDQKVQNLMDDIHQWADETFGVNRTPSATAKHLSYEANELVEALQLFKEYPTEKNKIKAHKEFADCFILILNAASKHGLNVDHLLQFATSKIGECKERIWNEPDQDGVCTHVKTIRGISTERYIELHGRSLAIDHSKAEREACKKFTHKNCAGPQVLNNRFA